MNATHKVFVYGTLKRGEPNHHWFGKSADKGGNYKFISEAQTVTKYPLIIGSQYNVPFLLYSPGTGYNVQGELYEVDDKVFADLDELESHPSFYVREINKVKTPSGETVDAWVYFIKNFKEHLLQSKMIECYSNRTTDLKYVERYLRDPNFSVSSGILKL